MGIPEEKLKISFVKKPGVGLGLELAISRECARLLGAEIAVESTLGKGSVGSGGANT